DPVQVEGQFTILSAEPTITAVYQSPTSALYGVFNVSGLVDVMPTPLPDGNYINLLSELNALVSVRDGEMAIPDAAVIVRVDGVL
ncbi:MAG: hypothetical protein GY943_38015, partial [Chloroflexi bacterium]|nr:hypothetical protein [Chloroflexota bacterium]